MNVHQRENEETTLADLWMSKNIIAICEKRIVVISDILDGSEHDIIFEDCKN